MRTMPYIPKLATMAHKFLTLPCNSALGKCVHPLCCTKLSYLHESWRRPLVLSGDMLRNRGLVLLTIFNVIYQISTEHILNINGWIPMSHNDIYNQIKRASTEYPVYLTMKPTMFYDNNLLQRQTNTKTEFKDFKGTFEVLNEKPFDIDTVADKTESNQNILNTKEVNSIRNGKKFWNHDVEIDVDNILELPEIKISKTEDSQTSVSNEEKSVNASSKAYEVTEDTDRPSTEDIMYTTENIGYQYNPPTDENQNLTSTFYKILSKYNIKSEDKLLNYDLSLQRKVQSSSAGPYRVPLPYGYNNLNHLAVNPLLAVFLSNYGVYLPSLYGIKANYNNLYGYLASNNIHNNRPFGLYKVFSDTDSWN